MLKRGFSFVLLLQLLRLLWVFLDILCLLFFNYMLVLYHKTEDKSKKKTHRSAFLSSLKGISKEKPSNKDNNEIN